MEGLFDNLEGRSDSQNFEPLYIKKLHYQKVSCVKTFKQKFFYFLCCIFSKYGFYNCEFQIIIVPIRNLCEIYILSRFFKFYVIHLSRLLLFKFSWNQFNLKN